MAECTPFDIILDQSKKDVVAAIADKRCGCEDLTLDIKLTKFGVRGKWGHNVPLGRTENHIVYFGDISFVANINKEVTGDNLYDAEQYGVNLGRFSIGLSSPDDKRFHVTGEPVAQYIELGSSRTVNFEISAYISLSDDWSKIVFRLNSHAESVINFGLFHNGYIILKNGCTYQGNIAIPVSELLGSDFKVLNHIKKQGDAYSVSLDINKELVVKAGSFISDGPDVLFREREKDPFYKWYDKGGNLLKYNFGNTKNASGFIISPGDFNYVATGSSLGINDSLCPYRLEVRCNSCVAEKTIECAPSTTPSIIPSPSATPSLSPRPIICYPDSITNIVLSGLTLSFDYTVQASADVNAVFELYEDTNGVGFKILSINKVVSGGTVKVQMQLVSGLRTNDAFITTNYNGNSCGIYPFKRQLVTEKAEAPVELPPPSYPPPDKSEVEKMMDVIGNIKKIENNEPINLDDFFNEVGLLGGALDNFIKQVVVSVTPTPTISTTPSVGHETCSECVKTKSVTPSISVSPTPTPSVSYTVSNTVSPSKTPSISISKSISQTPSTSTITVVDPNTVVASDGTYPDKVLVTWNGAANNYFNVYRSEEFSTVLVEIGSWQTGMSFEDFGANGSQVYYYFIRAASNIAGDNPSNYGAPDQGWRSEAATPSVTPSVTKSVSVTPSISKTPSLSVTSLVTTSETPSITPSTSITPSITPSVTGTAVSASVTPSVSQSISITPSPSVNGCVYDVPYYILDTICHFGSCTIGTGVTQVVKGNNCSNLTLFASDYVWEVEVSNSGGANTYNVNPAAVQGDADSVVLFSVAVETTCLLSNVTKRLYFLGNLIWEKYFPNFNQGCFDGGIHGAPICCVQPSVTPSVSVSLSITPSVTPSISISPSVSESLSISVSTSITGTPSISISPSVSITPSITPSISPSTSDTSSITPSVSVSATSGISPSITPSVTPSNSITPSVTSSVTPSNTPSNSITPSISITKSATKSVTSSVTPSVTSLLSSSITPSVTKSISITPSVTKSISTTKSITPSNSETPSITPSNTVTPSVTPSETPSVTVSTTTLLSPSITPSVTPSETPSISISVTPSITPSVSMTVSVSNPTCECESWDIYSYYGAPIYVTGINCDGSPYSETLTNQELFTICLRANTGHVEWDEGECDFFCDFEGFQLTYNGTCGSWGCGEPTPSVSVTPSVTPSETPSITPSATPSISISPSNTATPSITPSVSSSITPSISISPSVTRSVTKSITISPSVTKSISITPSITPSVTKSISITPSITPSISKTPSITPSVTKSISITPSITPSNSKTPSITPTITPSISISPSVTKSITISPSVTPSVTKSISITPTITPSISKTPSITPSVTKSISLTPSITPSVSASSAAATMNVYAKDIGVGGNAAPDLEYKINGGSPISIASVTSSTCDSKPTISGFVIGDTITFQTVQGYELGGSGSVNCPAGTSGVITYDRVATGSQNVAITINRDNIP